MGKSGRIEMTKKKVDNDIMLLYLSSRCHSHLVMMTVVVI